MADMAAENAIEYLVDFRSSHLEEYGFALQEYRVGGNSGYAYFHGSDRVVQTMQNIYATVDESFGNLTVPGGFVTPAARTRFLQQFVKQMEDQGIEFQKITTEMIRQERARPTSFGDWNDSDLIPDPLREIDRIRQEVLEAVQFALKLEQGTEVSATNSLHEQVMLLLLGFPRFVAQLGQRRQGRNTLLIKDEYDVQDALHSLLKLHFPAVIAEDYTSNYAGSASRVDFVLDEDVLIEVKMASEKLRDKLLGDQIAADMVRYPTHRKCKTVYFFVYDPDHKLKNPDLLVRQLTLTRESVQFHTVIVPRL
ncbi:PD-(D/E)XK nuclease domain-containing protein [Rhizobium leguminosarum]